MVGVSDGVGVMVAGVGARPVGGDIARYPCAHLTGAVVLATLDLNVGCAHVGIEGGVDGAAYQCALGSQSEVFHHHRCRQYLCHGVGYVFPRRLGP